MSDRPTIRVRGEDVSVGEVRVNARALLSAALGVDLDDQALADILHGLRESLVPPGEIDRAMDGIEQKVTEFRQLVSQITRRPA